MNVCVSCPFGRLLTFSSAQKMDSTALPLHLPTPWVEWSYQSSNLPAGEKWVASLWAVTQHLASCPCFVMLFIKLWFSLYISVSAGLAMAELLFSCHVWGTTLICNMSQVFSVIGLYFFISVFNIPALSVSDAVVLEERLTLICVLFVLSDGASRMEVRQAYPDPPSDDHSLDIQQQALLRQQQRTINSLRRGRPAG